jgi:hypothetical protein
MMDTVSIGKRMMKFHTIPNLIGDKRSKEFEKLVEDLQDILRKKYDVDFYAGGVDGLEVRVVNGPYKITEYDGYETVIEQNNSEYWFY